LLAVRITVIEAIEVQPHAIQPAISALYRGVDNFLARPTFRCILFDCENIPFDASLVTYIYIYIYIYIVLIFLQL